MCYPLKYKSFTAHCTPVVRAMYYIAPAVFFAVVLSLPKFLEVEVSVDCGGNSKIARRRESRNLTFICTSKPRLFPPAAVNVRFPHAVPSLVPCSRTGFFYRVQRTVAANQQ